MKPQYHYKSVPYSGVPNPNETTPLTFDIIHPHSSHHSTAQKRRLCACYLCGASCALLLAFAAFFYFVEQQKQHQQPLPPPTPQPTLKPTLPLLTPLTHDKLPERLFLQGVNDSNYISVNRVFDGMFSAVPTRVLYDALWTPVPVASYPDYCFSLQLSFAPTHNLKVDHHDTFEFKQGSMLFVCNSNSAVSADVDGNLILIDVEVAAAEEAEERTHHLLRHYVLFKYVSYSQRHGVNLGNWFIPEYWMQPSFYDKCVGMSLCQVCSAENTNCRNELDQRMRTHLETWIKPELDFVKIAEKGLNSVRIPLGYWNVVPDPYNKFAPIDPEFSLRLLDTTMNAAAANHIDVILDLHGAAGSQNALDHSGCIGSSTWLEPQNVDLNIRVIQTLANRYSKHSALLGIELVNEPSCIWGDKLLEYYRRAYIAIAGRTATIINLFCYWDEVDASVVMQKYISSIYNSNINSKNNYNNNNKRGNIIVDLHVYDWSDNSVSQHIETLNFWKRKIESLSASVIIGEWSLYSGVHGNQTVVDYSVNNAFANTLGWYLWAWKTAPESGFVDFDFQRSNLTV